MIISLLDQTKLINRTMMSYFYFCYQAPMTTAGVALINNDCLEPWNNLIGA